MASLAATFGRGAMTNGWVDIKNADVILCMGGNPAENHPCGFKWVMEARRNRNAKVVAVDPRFTRTAAVADLYSPIRSGADVAYLLGIIRYAIDKKRYHEDYVRLHTNAPYIIGEKFGFTDGLFSGFDDAKKEYDKTQWGYQADEKTKGYVLDETMQNPRCVFQLLKQHVDRYTPETVEKICGVPKETFLKVAELVTSTYTPDRAGTIMYALGWTQHSTGVQIIRCAAMLQLLLGNVGRPGGGVNALRGHSNIQGATDMGGNTEILPGYLKTPQAQYQTLAEFLEGTTPTTLGKVQWASMNYWQNTPKFMVSLLKSLWGAKATKENDFGYGWMPKLDGNYSWVYMFDDMYRGSSKRAGGDEPGPEGLIAFGMNPVGTGPNTPKIINALAKLKWLVVVENVETETAMFWKAPKEYGGPDASKIQTEVFLLPAALFAEKDGTLTNSARWAQWKWKALEPPGTAKADQEILARLVLAVQGLYKKEGGKLPDPVLNVSWSYTDRSNPDLSEVLKEISGKALADIPDPKDKTKTLKTAGQQLDGFAQLRQLALLGRLHRGGEQYAAPLERGPDRPRHVPQLGVRVAGEPAHHVQPRVRRQGRESLGSHACRHQVERGEMGRRRARHEARRATRHIRRLHHAARGRRPPLRAVPQRRPVPRALRGERGPGRQPPPPEGEREPRRQTLHERQGPLRQEGRLPGRLHHVSPHRALPLLDAAQPAAQRGRADVLLRAAGGVRAGEGDRA